MQKRYYFALTKRREKSVWEYAFQSYSECFCNQKCARKAYA